MLKSIVILFFYYSRDIRFFLRSQSLVVLENLLIDCIAFFLLFFSELNKFPPLLK